MSRADPVAALVGCCGHVLDLEDPADRLVLEPLADVALVAAAAAATSGGVDAPPASAA